MFIPSSLAWQRVDQLWYFFWHDWGQTNTRQTRRPGSTGNAEEVSNIGRWAGNSLAHVLVPALRDDVLLKSKYIYWAVIGAILSLSAASCHFLFIARKTSRLLEKTQCPLIGFSTCKSQWFQLEGSRCVLLTEVKARWRNFCFFVHELLPNGKNISICHHTVLFQCLHVKQIKGASGRKQQQREKSRPLFPVESLFNYVFNMITSE